MARSFEISKKLVWQAYERVKANKGAEGIDGQTMEDFERNLKGNLYKIWSRMTSGSYIPPAVMAVTIPKRAGGSRVLDTHDLRPNSPNGSENVFGARIGAIFSRGFIWLSSRKVGDTSSFKNQRKMLGIWLVV
jgi:hypothetical protein